MSLVTGWGDYVNRDHLRGLVRALILTSVSGLVFGPDSRVHHFLSEPLSLTDLSFYRKQEHSADEYALTYIQCLYDHVDGVTDFLKNPQSTRSG